jgi:hypothetical protein
VVFLNISGDDRAYGQVGDLKSIVCLQVTANEKACGQVGNLKHLRPNVSRYKLMIMSHLTLFKRLPSAETKV